MPRHTPLTALGDWSHRLLAEVLRAGDLAVDLTAGNGYDTRFLAETVGPGGMVLGFDIQPQALANAARRLEAAGFEPRLHRGRRPPACESGVVLVDDGHEAVADYLPGAAKAFIANLGYLPGGDKQLVTRPRTTLMAVSAALNHLAPGGRLAVMVYPGHPGGEDERGQLEQLLELCSADSWDVLRIDALNRDQAPCLLIVEKRCDCSASVKAETLADGFDQQPS